MSESSATTSCRWPCQEFDLSSRYSYRPLGGFQVPAHFLQLVVLPKGSGPVELALGPSYGQAQSVTPRFRHHVFCPRHGSLDARIALSPLSQTVLARPCPTLPAPGFVNEQHSYGEPVAASIVDLIRGGPKRRGG